MKIKWAFIFGILIIAAGIGLRQALAQRDSQQTCTITVPAEWGEYKGASRDFGLAFQDSAGTLRFVRNVGCQIPGTAPVPLVSLEVRRK